jgi:pimeloyl-ACP methyl ester carboxylesterase
MLPAKGPWEHPYYAIEDAFLNVTFTDTAGETHSIGVRHKVTGDGPPLVLVHGLMTSSYSFRYVLEPLGRRYRVFAPDLVGAGLSDKPLDFTYSVENVARFLAAYIRGVSRDPVYLVGNSLGGLYSLRALMLDRQRPTPLRSVVRPLARRFVLMHAPGYPLVRTRLLSTIFSTPGLGFAAAALVARSAHKFPQAFVAKNMHYARKDMMSEEECTEYGRLFETLDGARVFAKILEESLDPEEHARIIAELRTRATPGNKLECPIKILYARKDVMVPPSFGPLFHGDLPGSELVWMDDVSHFLHVDAPERTVAEITSFDPDYVDQVEGIISVRSGRFRAASTTGEEKA